MCAFVFAFVCADDVDRSMYEGEDILEGKNMHG